MRWRALSKLIVATAAALAAAVAQPAALFTIGPDTAPLFPVPRVLNQLPTTAPVAAAPLATLGDGSAGFNGGLAYSTGNSLLYAIGNDALGNSTLYSTTTLGGSLTSIGAVGVGFNGGLAYDSSGNELYAVGNDFLGNSTLFKVDATTGVATPLGVGPVGVGFYGGLTYNADDGLLYAIAGDLFGVMRSLVSIDPATLAVSALFLLGDGSVGFNGGLAYDDVADLFFVVGNDVLADSALYSFTLADAGAVSAIGSTFGQGFLNLGLALAPAVTPPPPPPPGVSEPQALALVALAALLAAAFRRRDALRRSRSTSVPQGSRPNELPWPAQLR